METNEIKSGKSKKRKIVILCVICSVLLCAVAVSFLYIKKTKEEKLRYIKENTVPNVTGMSKSEAEEVLRSTGWKYLCDVEYVDDQNVPIDEIISQSIEAGTVVDKTKNRLTLVRCVGYCFETIPNMNGKTEEQAKDMLKKLSNQFTIRVHTEALEDESIIDNTVYKYSASKIKGIIRSDSIIDLYVKEGTIKKFPNMKNLTKDEAVKIINDCGMKYKLKEEYSETVGKGKVINFTGDTYITGKVEEYVLTLSLGKDTRILIPTVDSEWENLWEKGFDTCLNNSVKKLESAGCKVIVEYKYFDITNKITAWEANGGSLIKQDKYGRVEEKTPTVTLTVNKPAIRIDGMGVELNSVGGADTRLTITNISNKQIRYIYIDIAYYDRVGGKAYCTVTNQYTKTLKYTGPLNAGEQTKGLHVDAVIYNYNIAAYRPVSAKIEFTDGTTQKLNYNNGYWYNKSFYGGDIDF